MYALERGEASGGLLEGILCILGPMGGSGSSCAGCHNSRPGDISQSPESSTQSGH